MILIIKERNKWGGYMNQLIRSELLTDETILWSGQPNKNKIFNLGDIYLIPFSIVWCGFICFWEYTVLVSTAYFFALFGLLFVFVGLYLLIGRFIYKNYVRANTYYFITQKRILILKDANSRKLEAEFISAIPCINKNVDSSGRGTIIFGNSSGHSGIYNDSGLDLLGTGYRYGKTAPTFYDIEQGDEVYRIVNEIRNIGTVI